MPPEVQSAVDATVPRQRHRNARARARIYLYVLSAHTRTKYAPHMMMCLFEASDQSEGRCKRVG
jgi:hypothetical protein